MPTGITVGGGGATIYYATCLYLVLASRSHQECRFPYIGKDGDDIEVVYFVSFLYLILLSSMFFKVCNGHCCFAILILVHCLIDVSS